jgi:hypothetical protein
MHERLAIVGTAQSWNKTPWTDSGLYITSLNDAYRMKGFVRADAWYDLHPLDKFHYPEGTQIYAHQIPAGHYCRPKGHLEWLASQTVPVWLHPDYATQHPAAASWPHARAFPKAAVEAHVGRYVTSSPAWMIGQALLDGVKELHIYGIHLATEHEYIEQRPNFEMLCGALLGRGKRTVTVKDGLRRYETQDGILVLPEATPVCTSNFQYAFETRPRAHDDPIKWELHKIEVKRQRLLDGLKRKARWSPFVVVPDPTHGPTATSRFTTWQVQEQLFQLDALAQDQHEILGRLHAQSGG